MTMTYLRYATKKKQRGFTYLTKKALKKEGIVCSMDKNGNFPIKIIFLYVDCREKKENK